MEYLTQEIIDQSPDNSISREYEQKLRGILTEQLLQRQNRRFANTMGVSRHNRKMGFVPAFLDTQSGVSVISRFADGSPASVHILDGLPERWIIAFDENGHVTAVRDGVIAGFILEGHFYTREEAARAH